MAKHRARSRSTNPDDYQRVRRPIAAMSKIFKDGFEITPHHHPRTHTEAWIVPPDRAVYLPAHVEHSISIRGLVTMSTLYIAPRVQDGLPAAPSVLEVSGRQHLLGRVLIDAVLQTTR